MQISKIILWPINGKNGYRCIDFLPGKVSYIVGGPETGKSSIWQIIDYCLGSSKLRVPIGVVRDLVSWYGIVLEDKNEEILLARKNSSIEGFKSEYMLIREAKIQIPETPIKNVTSEFKIKEILSKSFDIFLSGIENYILEELEDQKIGKFSYRDLLILNHQMQYSLVNPSSFISDSNYISVIKLKKLLPIILYPKGKGFYKIRKSIQGKVEIQLQTIKEEISYLKDRMIILYNDAHRLGMVENYIKPQDYPDRTAEIYRKELEHILMNHESLLKNIQENRNESVALKNSHQIFLLGKIDECLKFSLIISKVKTLGNKYSILDNEIKQLDVTSKSNLDVDILDLSKLIQIYAQKMELDFLEYRPVFDDREAILKFQINYGEDILLYQLGSSQNYVGYNIASFLGFHEVFIKQNCEFVFPFLIIDHPSHSFSNGQKNEDSRKINALYSALDLAVERMKNKFQIIVLERKAPEEISSYSNSKIVENWLSSDGDTLIPKTWKIT